MSHKTLYTILAVTRKTSAGELKDLLVTNRIDHIKWLPILNNLGIETTSDLTIERIKEFATEAEITSFKIIQLKLELEKAGLNPLYWIGPFKRVLKVESVEALKKLDSASYKSLESYTKVYKSDMEILKSMFERIELERKSVGITPDSSVTSSYAVINVNQGAHESSAEHLPSNLEDSFEVIESYNQNGKSKHEDSNPDLTSQKSPETGKIIKPEKSSCKDEKESKQWQEMEESGYVTVEAGKTSNDESAKQENENKDSLQHEMEKASESQNDISAKESLDEKNELENIQERSVEFDNLLKMLNLEEYYPQKLKAIASTTIREIETSTDFKQLPYRILQMIMLLNSDCMTCLMSTSTESDDPPYPEDGNPNEESESAVHPIDVLLALIHCSDNFLRQSIYSKLATCQLAVPLLLPDPKEGTVTLMLWAMRSIVKEWKQPNGESTEQRIVDCTAPIVSFMRYGNLNEFSKSELLSNILSKHNHFFYWNMIDGPTPKRRAVDGLVDVCWYLPSGKKDDTFHSVVTFANLHGDCSSHPQQREFLAKASYMNVLLVSQLDGLCESEKAILESLSQAPAGLLLVVCDKDAKVESNNYKLCFRRGKPVARLTKDLAKHIESELKKPGVAANSRCICDFKTLVIDGIDIDDNYEEKQQATEICDLLRENSSQDGKKLCKDEGKSSKGEEKQSKDEGKSNNEGMDKDEEKKSEDEEKSPKGKSIGKEKSFKDKLLPLQGTELWMKWAEVNKELHRMTRQGNTKAETYRSYQVNAMKKIRNQQRSEMENCLIIKKFISFLSTSQSEINYPFYQLLKLMLEDNSREQQTKIGLEHLFREVGQMYEATQELGHKQLLRNVAAKLLIDGHPIELMDGDAAHVPITWVKAVLTEVGRILDNPKVFVLSILGVQSSGKSTLLNTMFGIQFKVSAGRCTRGAFVQLLPIEMSLRETLKCDYILVIDTEGLHSPESDHKKDNEIATFVIGLADITIVNIFGEVPVDMENILQTAVHAFLRMKRVKLNPRVLFAHQNVPSLMANDKGTLGRNFFFSKLDEMTCNAAKLEDCEEKYKSFRDMVSFDPETDIYFFPSLWKGDPPMAPVNPGYSERVEELKTRVLNLLQIRNSSRPILKFITHMSDVWEAVLCENFVFSFKNSLELSAYMALESKVNEWSWNLQKQLLKWEQRTKNRINSAEQCKVRELEGTCIGEATKIWKEWYDSTEEEMEEFFKGSDHKEYLSQWKCRTQTRLLTHFFSEQTHSAINYCQKLASNKYTTEQILQRHRKQIRDHVAKLVSKADQGTGSEELFDKKWSEWMQELVQVQIPVDQSDNIQQMIDGSLKRIFHAYTRFLIEKPPLQSKQKAELFVKPDRHFPKTDIPFIKKGHNPYAQDASNKFLLTAKRYIDDCEENLQHLGPNVLDEMFKKVFDAVQKCEVKFNTQYKVDLAFEVGQYALYRLKSLANELRKKNDPVEYFRDRKETFFSEFKAQYEQIAEHKQCAIVLVSLLKTSVVHAVSNSLAVHVVSEMKATSSKFATKFSLKTAVLTEIAIKGEFSLFCQYIDDTESSLKYWIGEFVEEHCNAKSQDSESTRIEVLVEKKLKELIEHLQAIVKLTMVKTSALEPWLKQFHQAVTSNGEISLNLEEVLSHMTKHKLNDTEFKVEFLRSMKEIEISSKAVLDKKGWKINAINVLSKELIGCCAQCPFCKEQCDLGADHEDATKHIVQSHRPQCLGSFRLSRDNSMMLDICITSVKGSGLFKASALGDDKFHHYYNYHKFYPNWKITPNASASASLYWKWFVANYTREIAKNIRAKEANTSIPSDWKEITKEQAIESLQALY